MYLALRKIWEFPLMLPNLGATSCTPRSDFSSFFTFLVMLFNWGITSRIRLWRIFNSTRVWYDHGLWCIFLNSILLNSALFSFHLPFTFFWLWAFQCANTEIDIPLNWYSLSKLINYTKEYLCKCVYSNYLRIVCPVFKWPVT